FMSPQISVTPGVGKGALDTWRSHWQRGGRTQSRYLSRSVAVGRGCRQTNEGGVYCGPALQPRYAWEDPQRKSQGFKLDSGDPTVQDYRGASGNVAMVELGTPPCNRKSEDGNSPPKAGALELYPNPLIKENARQPNTYPTQSGKGVSQGLAGGRKAGKEKKGRKLPGLVPHLTHE